MNNNQQEWVTVKLKAGDPALTPVEVPGNTGYTINYTYFIPLGNTNDTVTINLNGVPGIVLSMLGTVNVPINYLEVTSVQNTSGFTATTDIGLLVFGIKRYNTIFSFQ